MQNFFQYKNHNLLYIPTISKQHLYLSNTISQFIKYAERVKKIHKKLNDF